MKRRTSGILLVLMIITCTANSQQRSSESMILFRGVVISNSTQERLAGSQIYINRRSHTVSHDDGTFSFYASSLDTIIFTMLGYKPETLIVPDTLRSKEFLTGVYLQQDTLEIGEVIIIPSLANLKAEIMNPRIETNVQLENAKSNISIAAYQGRTSELKMGDPDINYRVLRNKQTRAAYEKGGIPADQIAGINPFILIPAVYLLLHGMPEIPEPPKPGITQKDLDELNRRHQEFLKNKK